MARQYLGNELNIVRRVRLFREHKLLLEALQKVIDTKKIRKDAKYTVLDHEIPPKAITEITESSNSETEGQKPKEQQIVHIQSEEDSIGEHEDIKFDATTRRKLEPLIESDNAQKQGPV